MKAMEMVAEAKSRVENLGVEEVAREIEEGQPVLVDIRESEERSEHGTIPEAHHAPRGMLEFYADPETPYHRDELDPSARVILYCASGGRSALACDMLGRLGYTNVAHLDGGFKSWTEAGKPVAEVK
jgi:rhodanese-related sulfurtransferase